MFDAKKLTLGEIATIEDLSGVSLDLMELDATPKGKMLAALLFVHRRRTAMVAGNPPASVTWASIQDVPLDEAAAELGYGIDDEPEGDEPDLTTGVTPAEPAAQEGSTRPTRPARPRKPQA